MRSLLLALTCLLLLTLPLAAQTDESDARPDDLLVDATFVPCNDSTESMLILRDGRAVYAIGNRGASFNVLGAMLVDLQRVVDSAQSVVNPSEMDSCSTLGVILDGPRFLLINTSNPSKEAHDLDDRLERIRKMAARRLDGTLDHFGDKPDAELDSNISQEVSVSQMEIRRHLRLSPIAREWRCAGSVFVVAQITNQGKARLAFVRQAKVRGKCGPVLAATALRAVLLAEYAPAKNKRGKPTASWIEVEVPFTRQKPGK
jgi:hypothetical protein